MRAWSRSGLAARSAPATRAIRPHLKQSQLINVSCFTIVASMSLSRYSVEKRPDSRVSVLGNLTVGVNDVSQQKPEGSFHHVKSFTVE